MTLSKFCSRYPTQAAAAEALGVTQPELSRWLAGKHTMSPDKASALAVKITMVTAQSTSELELLYPDRYAA